MIAVDEEDAEWDGMSRSAEKGKEKATEHEEEYEDEEQLATVTVVEDFDLDTIIRGPSQPGPLIGDEEPATTSLHPPKPSRNVPPEVKKTQSKTVAKTKPVKYQTNSARKVERSKQLKRKTEKAQRAGGKPTRGGGRGKGKR